MKAIVLAAGKGTRMLKDGEDIPKAMKELKGRPILAYILDAFDFLEKENVHIVVGYKKEKIMDSFPGYSFVFQAEQKGTGHAVAVCRESFEGYKGPVMVVLGDMPMLKRETFESMFELHAREDAACTMLTAVTERKLPYGRIIRDENGAFSRIVEEKDCTPQQKEVKELNPSVFVFDSEKLFVALASLKNNNAQGEYYLTDVPAIMLENGEKVVTDTIYDDIQILGLNTPQDLAQCESLIK